MTELRWKQRFRNFQKAYEVFERILSIENPNEAERMGLIKSYEILFELSWKLIKDYLSVQGFDVRSPREAFKRAFQIEIISDGEIWLSALENRNETVHTYDETTALQTVELIKEKYSKMFKELYLFFERENLKDAESIE